MKLFRMLKFGIRDAIKSVHRNFSLSIASISCISITLLVVSLALLASFNVNNFSKEMEREVAMVVFLDYGVTNEQIANFETELKKNDNIDPDWKMTTPTERKNQLIEEDEFLSSIAASIHNEEEIFHYSYSIKVKDITKIDNTVAEIEQMEHVNLVNYGKSWISRMLSTFDVVEKIAVAIVLTLILVTVFLIVNTIKLTIFSRRREISIMRVVGASNWTIRNPFIIEGFVIGLLGSIIPVVATIYGYMAFYNSSDNGTIISPLFQLLSPQPFVYIVSFIIVVIGVLVGMFGSGRAVRKYLKV